MIHKSLTIKQKKKSLMLKQKKMNKSLTSKQKKINKSLPIKAQRRMIKNGKKNGSSFFGAKDLSML